MTRPYFALKVQERAEQRKTLMDGPPPSPSSPLSALRKKGFKGAALAVIAANRFKTGAKTSALESKVAPALKNSPTGAARGNWGILIRKANDESAKPKKHISVHKMDEIPAKRIIHHIYDAEVCLHFLALSPWASWAPRRSVI